MKKILTLLLVLFAATGYSQVVISGLYAGGGSGGALYLNDYVELHNMGTSSVDINGYTIQYRADGATSKFSVQYTVPASTIIPPGGYYLIASADQAQAGAVALPVTPDVKLTSGLLLKQGGGSLALSKTNTLIVDCATFDGCGNVNLADLVGWGTGRQYLGNKITAPNVTSAAQRKLKGNIDTRNNLNDFVSPETPNPRSSASLPFKISNLSDVLISQVYPGGGNASSTYKNAYIEIRNNGDDDLDISGFSLQYATGTGDYGGSGNNYVYPFQTGTVIGAGKYILVQTAKATGVTGADIPTPDIIMGGDTISTTTSASGKIALSGQSAKLACGGDATPCAVGVLPFLLDSVGWATTAPRPVLGDDTKGLVRKTGGCTNTGDNTADFDVITNPVPRNGATPAVTCAALPLNLTSFSVQKAGSNVQINWSTAQEQNSKNFEVQRSTDQNNWSTVATVAATGSSNTTANYSATDYSPAQGVNYYRLKIVDADNSFAMSEVKSVNFASGFAVSISPNPASTYINVTLGGNGSSRVIMSDLNGKVVYNQTTTAPKLQINSSTFAKGMYIIKVVNGADISTNKVIVQ